MKEETLKRVKRGTQAMRAAIGRGVAMSRKAKEGNMTKQGDATVNEVHTSAAQGDLLVRRIKAIPGTAKAKAFEGQLVLAHSETGHHHAIDAALVPGIGFFADAENPLISYVRVPEGMTADVVHHRDFDTHGTLRLYSGDHEVRRQREWTPEGWAIVAD